MTRIYTLLILLLTHLYSFGQGPVFRWDVKTLTDQSGIAWATQIAIVENKRLASIEGLTKKAIQFSSCHNVGMNTRRSDEKRVVKIQVQLIAVKKEDNDKDYHVIVQSLTNSNHRMVVEIPNPDNEEYNDPSFADLKEMFNAARTTIKNLLQSTVTGSLKNFPGNPIVTIYGVPFWDCKHPGSVSGASWDFREIHPVMRIEL